MHFRKGILGIGLIACSVTAGAVQFTAGDWEVACDNTGRCRAAGYESEAQIDQPIVLKIERQAGPETPISVSLIAEWPKQRPEDKVTLTVGSMSVTTDAAFNLPATTFRHALPRLLDADQAHVTFAGRHGALSLLGMKAVLLKFDDLQGRVGTPSALVARGTRSESSVPSPRPAPLVRPISSFPSKTDDGRLLSELLPKLHADCDVPQDAMVSNSSIRRVADDRLIVLQACFRGQHDYSSAVWLVTDRAPHPIRRLTLPQLNGNDEEIVYGASFDGQAIHATTGSASGECESAQDWAWTGEAFVLTEVNITLLCRDPAGGASHRIYTTRQ